MNVLIACEFSATVREAFRRKGHFTYSCDLLDTEIPGNHYKGSIFDILDFGWDLMIAHPPCTYLTVAANKWMKPEYEHRWPTRKSDRIDAIKFFMRLYNAPIDKIAIENPVGIMSTDFRKPDQIIQPYQFGENASKTTCLWLKGLPILAPTKYINPRIVNGKKRWSNQTDVSGSNNLKFHPDRWKERSRTYHGIADAMAEQWGAIT